MGKEFIWQVRAYYEDTDAGGVIFYANYLRFMERARTEWLRNIGFEHKQLIDKYKLLFAVKNLTIDYTKSEKISGLVEPYTGIGIEGMLFLFNTYEILYLYQNYKFDDIGESSDKYRITEQHINWLGFGVAG